MTSKLCSPLPVVLDGSVEVVLKQLSLSKKSNPKAMQDPESICVEYRITPTFNVDQSIDMPIYRKASQA